MRRFFIATTAAIGVGAAALRFASPGAAVRGVSSSSSSSLPIRWRDLSTESLALYAEKALGVTEEKDGVVFTDILGLDDELLAMIPDDCVGVILCHPVDERIAALKKGRMGGVKHFGSGADEMQGAAPVQFFTTMKTLAGSSAHGGCGPCAILNVLGNASSPSSANASAGPSTADHTSSAVSSSASSSSSSSLLPASLDKERLHAANREITCAYAAPSASSSDEPFRYHYTAFVPDATGTRLVELDGLASAPMDWGALPPAAATAATLPRRDGSFIRGTASVLKKYFDTTPNRMDFSAVAVSVIDKK